MCTGEESTSASGAFFEFSTLSSLRLDHDSFDDEWVLQFDSQKFTARGTLVSGAVWPLQKGSSLGNTYQSPGRQRELAVHETRLSLSSSYTVSVRRLCCAAAACLLSARARTTRAHHLKPLPYDRSNLTHRNRRIGQEDSRACRPNSIQQDRKEWGFDSDEIASQHPFRKVASFPFLPFAFCVACLIVFPVCFQLLLQSECHTRSARTSSLEADVSLSSGLFSNSAGSGLSLCSPSSLCQRRTPHRSCFVHNLRHCKSLARRGCPTAFNPASCGGLERSMRPLGETVICHLATELTRGRAHSVCSLVHHYIRCSDDLGRNNSHRVDPSLPFALGASIWSVSRY